MNKAHIRQQTPTGIRRQHTEHEYLHLDGTLQASETACLYDKGKHMAKQKLYQNSGKLSRFSGRHRADECVPNHSSCYKVYMSWVARYACEGTPARKRPWPLTGKASSNGTKGTQDIPVFSQSGGLLSEKSVLIMSVL